MKALVTGWYSFEHMGATAGDLLTRDLVCDWLRDAGVEFDVALAPAFEGEVDWQEVDPASYSHVIFVCGPFGNGPPVNSFLKRFEGAELIGLNLSMLESLDRWNPFDLLLERDSSRTARPDLSFLTAQEQVPIVGLVLVHPQEEYGDRGRHETANNALRDLTRRHTMAVVPIDTQLDVNDTGLRTSQEVESLVARMDVVLTTRLHGTVLALKNGVPPIAVDPIAGGAKITRQTETIEWPVSFTTDELTEEDLDVAFDFCLTKEASAKAEACSKHAIGELENVKSQFQAVF